MGLDSDLFLAIDQGTSTAKVLVFDVSGRVVAASEHETLIRHPRTNRIESNAEDWWRAAAAGIRSVLSDGKIRAERIRGIGVCGFMHTLVAVDSDGRALHPAMLWPDQRAFLEVDDLAPYAELVTRTTGRGLNTMSSLPRLLWLRKHAPEVMASARAFLLTKDVLRLRLTGELATDLEDADGTGLVDIATGQWSGELLDLIGIPVERMPRIRRPDEIAGTVTQSASDETGLCKGTPVVIGTGDWPATLIGSGCFLPERTCFYLGTAGILGSFASPEDLDSLGATCYFGSVTSTGSALRWVRELLFGDVRKTDVSAVPPDYARMCADAERSEPGARGLIFLPHMLGERGGRMRPHARGTFHGLTLAHERQDLIRAVMEGTVMWLRATSDPYTDGRTLGEFLAYGGGTRSRLWREICTSVFNRRLLVPEVVEGGALGTAMLAAVGTGLGKSYRALGQEWTRIVAVEEPNPDLVQEYEGLYSRFRNLEAALSPLNSTPPT